MTSVVNVNLPSEKLLTSVGGAASVLQQGGWGKQQQQEREEERVREELKARPPKPEEVEELKEALDETLVGKGIGRALEVFRSRGMLSSVRAIGRTKDKTLEEELSKFEPAPSDRIKLEYTD